MSLPCVKEPLRMKTIDLSCGGHPSCGGLVELWYIFDSTLLHRYLEDFDENYHEMSADVRRVLRSAHQHDDGECGRWEMVIVKHTVV